MSVTQRAFKDLLTGLQQNKLSLVDVIQSLNARGQVQSPLHRAELSMLDEALAAGKLDEKMHRLLSAKLKDLQNAKMVDKTTKESAYKPPVGGDNDKTQMAGGDKTALNPASQDRTTINPSGGGDQTTINPSGAGGDATVINPEGSEGGDGFDLLMGQSDDGEATEMGGSETTGFKPSEPATKSKTGTGGPSTSSWQRVATAAAAGVEREVHAGDTLKDRFKLEKEVGRGGMGIVFKAIDERKVEAQDKNPWVAVKVLNPEFRKHPQALVALQRESRKAQQLTHDNILRVYDFDKDGTVIYMTMEYCDAGALKDWIKKNPNGMPWDKGWPVIQGLARGLGRAHRDNIVHSDFKPGNVMMTADGTPKLFDMGIARAAKSGADSKGETTVFDAGELGALTPAYASLEMIQGQPPELIDDIYALGITAYEILTGKHPFNKKNAEQAMKEGMKPPIVPGLSRTQQKALQQSVAFKRENRTKTCDALLEGLRPRTLKDSALPIMGGVFAVFVLVVLVFGVLFPQLKARRIDAVGQQFAAGAFADPNAAVAAVEAMADDEEQAAKQKYSQAMQEYFFKVASEKWNAAAKPPKYGFAEASAVLASVGKMFPDSARVATEVERLTGEKDDKLKALRKEYDERVAAGLIYEDRPGNVVETLITMAQIDPDYDVLKSKTLPLRYAGDIRRSMDAKNFERVAIQVATATKAFPNDPDLKTLAAETKTVREAEIAKAKERELRDKMTVAQAKEELMKLSGSMDFSADWQINVNVALSKLTADTSPETMAAKGKLAGAYAQQIGKMTGDKQLASAQILADSAMKNFPGVPALMTEVAKLTEARKAFEAEQAKAAALARVDDLKSTVITQAKANDVPGAVKALNELKGIVPNDSFLTNEAPKALAEAYLRSAERFATQNRFSDARRFVSEGLKLAPSNQALKDADKKYAVEGTVAVLQEGARSPATAKGDELKSAFDALRAADPARADKVGADVQSSVFDRLKTLTTTDPAAAGRGKAEWLKVFPQSTQLASLVIPTGVVAPPTTTAAATSPGTSLPQEAKKARVRGVESCFSNMAGFGSRSKAQCVDDVAGAPGPKLIVIPGPSGGFLAITKYEITAGQFNAFCSATGKCKSQSGNDALPRTNISLSQAKAYAQWLTETTGFNYRLPTDAEWAHATTAGGQGVGDAGNFNCVVMSGGSQIKGGIALPAATGASNAWGLVNGIGNAAEYVDSGSARGGHFNVPTTQCTVEWKQSGSESDAIGLRLVREMS